MNFISLVSLCVLLILMPVKKHGFHIVSLIIYTFPFLLYLKFTARFFVINLSKDGGSAFNEAHDFAGFPIGIVHPVYCRDQWEYYIYGWRHTDRGWNLWKNGKG